MSFRWIFGLLIFVVLLGGVFVAYQINWSAMSRMILEAERLETRLPPSTGETRSLQELEAEFEMLRLEESGLIERMETFPEVLGGPGAADERPYVEAEIERIRIEQLRILESIDALQTPQFPWPPPQPSSTAVLARDIFNSAENLEDVALLIEEALQEARYEYSFYDAPGGFALVAKLERVNADGSPVEERRRFLAPGEDSSFSMAKYIAELFYAPPGFYRMIVFVVSDRPFRADGPSIQTSEAQELLAGGINAVPPSARLSQFGDSHRVSALIYEFEKGVADRDVSALRPGRLSPYVHLERSGIATWSGHHLEGP